MQSFFVGTLHNHRAFCRCPRRSSPSLPWSYLAYSFLTRWAVSEPFTPKVLIMRIGLEESVTFNNIIANDIQRRNSLGYEGCQTNNSVRIGNEKMNRPIVDQTLSSKKGEALPKRGDADSADHIVRAYSPITTASHSIHSSNPITPSPKTCFRKRCILITVTLRIPLL